MFTKLLARLFGIPRASDLRTRDPARWEAALLERVKEMAPSDPLIGAKVGAKELASRLIDVMKDHRGIHVESLLCAAGALAGYSCQAAVRAKNRAEGLSEEAHLTLAKAQDGQTFYFGDALNKYLAESELSIWGIAAGGAQAAGCADILDVSAIFKHTAETVGSPIFGTPRLPEGHPVHEHPHLYLKRLWPTFAPLVERFCPNPDHWPVLFGLALQELISQTRGALDPCLSLQVIMESAVPMSKVSLGAA